MKKGSLTYCDDVSSVGLKVTFKYLGVMISTNGAIGKEVDHRLLEGRKYMGKWERERDI